MTDTNEELNTGDGSRDASRVPPHDLTAERALLSAMLLSADAIDDAAPILTHADFYSPANGFVFEAIIDLYLDAGSPPDLVVLADWLTRSGDLEVIGGKRYLATFTDGIPARAANYAQIIAANARKRRLIGALTEALDDAWTEAADPDDIIATAESVFNANAAISVGLPDGAQSVDEFLVGNHEPPPWVVPGLIRQRHRCLLVAGEGVGKALDVTTEVPTPTGWTTMGDLEPGDTVYGQDGKPCIVEWCSPIRLGRPCYRITFSDDTEVVADAEHLWEHQTYNDRMADGEFLDRHHVSTTAEMAGTLWARDGHTLNHSIETCAPVQFPTQRDLPIEPYTLGAWLGDGDSSGSGFTCADPQIVEEIRADGYTVEDRSYPSSPHGWRISRSEQYLAAIDAAMRDVQDGMSMYAAARGHGVSDDALRVYLNGGHKTDRRKNITAWSVVKQLRELDVINNKHIPTVYLRADVDQRLALLQGLMDTDGTVEAHGDLDGRGGGVSGCEFSVVNEQLALDVWDLIRSLGIKATMGTCDAVLNGRKIGLRYRIWFQTDLPVFRLERKAKRLHEIRTRRYRRRYITDIAPVESVPVRCIGVNSRRSLFLVTRSFLPTHNSTASRLIAMCAAQGVDPFFTTNRFPARNVLMVDLENPPDVIYETADMIERQLRTAKGDSYREHGCWIWTREEGIDIRNRVHAAELDRVCAHVQPSLVVLGPLYRCFTRRSGESHEDAAEQVQNALDRIRIRHNVAMLIEHHAPKGSGGKRDMIPFGSARWQFWPELGITLEKDPENVRALIVGRFRGDRPRVEWPTHLYRSSGWPFEGRFASDHRKWDESQQQMAGPF